MTLKGRLSPPAHAEWTAVEHLPIGHSGLAMPPVAVGGDGAAGDIVSSASLYSAPVSPPCPGAEAPVVGPALLQRNDPQSVGAAWGLCFPGGARGLHKGQTMGRGRRGGL